MPEIITKKLKQQKNQGAALVGTTIIILAVALILAASVEYLGIGESLMSLAEQQSEQSIEAAQSCLNEAVLRIKNDNSYTGGTLNPGSAACVIVVGGNPPAETISITATVGQSVRKIISN